MLIFDLNMIGDKLYNIRKGKGLSRAEIAECAGLSERTYADIERGSVNMRIKTVLSICEALKITPNEIFMYESNYSATKQNLLMRLKSCSEQEAEPVHSSEVLR